MKVTVYHARSGKAVSMPRAHADVMVRLGYYEHRAITQADLVHGEPVPLKRRRGRPTKAEAAARAAAKEQAEREQRAQLDYHLQANGQ